VYVCGYVPISPLVIQALLHIIHNPPEGSGVGTRGMWEMCPRYEWVGNSAIGYAAMRRRP
jgi:hypothetical protein